MTGELLGEYGRRRIVKTVALDAWNGSGVMSKELQEHRTFTQHQITVATSNAAATGVLRLRMRPTGLERDVAVDLDLLNLATINRSGNFIVSGFFDRISAQFTTPLSAGTVSAVIASVGENLSALPVAGTAEHGTKRIPHTKIADTWTGTGMTGCMARGHEGLALHHIALSCATVPSTGVVRIQGKQIGASFYANLAPPIDLTATGSANLFVVGFFEEFRIVVDTAITGAGDIDARVASAGEDLNELVTLDARFDEQDARMDGLEQDIEDVADDLAAHEAAPDPHPQYTTAAEVQAIADAKVIDSIADSDTTHAPSRNSVFDALALKANLASPALTGNPTAPTPSPGDNDTSIATTAFVTAAGAALVIDSIADSDTTHAPSRNSVFDALALKMDANRERIAFKNKIMNGSFLIWQRGSSLAAAAGSNRFLADRWASHSTGSTIAPSLQQFAVGQTDVPGNPLYFHRSVVASSAGAGNFALMTQRIEFLQMFSGTYTMSFWAKADASRSMSFEVVQAFGSGGSSPVDSIGVTKVNLTTSWQKFTITFTLPSISGKTLGTNNNLQITFWFDAGSTWNSRTDTLGQQSGTFDIAMVQMEQGSVATDFEVLEPGIDLLLCQRFFQVIYGADLTGQAAGATGVIVSSAFDPDMRTSPTLTLLKTSFAAASFEILVGGAWVSAATASLASPSSSAKGLTTQITGFSGLTAGQAVTFNTGPVISADADII